MTTHNRTLAALVMSAGLAVTWGCSEDRRADSDSLNDPNHRAAAEARAEHDTATNPAPTSTASTASARSTAAQTDRAGGAVHDSDLHEVNVSARAQPREMNNGEPLRNAAATDRSTDRASMAISPDARILSVLHAANLEEIEIGRLAQQNGSAADVKQYGQMLVTDHTNADRQVQSIASSADITLLSSAQLKELKKQAKAENNSADKNKGSDQTGGQDRPDRNSAEHNVNDRDANDRNTADRMNAAKDEDPVAKLRALKGADFDRAFAQTMAEGHRKVIAKVESARTQVQNPQVRELLDQMLPTLRHHAQTAEQLRSYSNADAPSKTDASR